MRVFERVKGRDIVLADVDAVDSGVTLSWSAAAEFLTIVTGFEQPILPAEIDSMCSLLQAPASTWPLLLPKQRRQEIVNMCQSQLESTFEDGRMLEYFNTWLQGRRFLDRLGRMRIDLPKFQEFTDSKAAIERIHPKTGATNVRYNTAGSTTGRLTITDGPNFLVLPKETRRCLLKDFSDSAIYSIDFTSLEPRVTFWLSSNDLSEEDVYEEVMNMCNIEDRETAKLATLSTLYGAGAQRLATTVGSLRQAKQMMERVSRYFGVPDIENKLAIQAENGGVKNHFGRPLHEATKNKRVRLNHYVQSTAAELAVLMFAKLCAEHPAVKPLLVIHDALIVEVPKSAEDYFFAACENMRHEGFWFPTKRERLDN